MIDFAQLGWDPATIGELDHRRLKTPCVKLRSVHTGDKGDRIFCVDLRVRPPNRGPYLSSTEAHSLEHFLLQGFQQRLPKHFLSVGLMGCRTGFYLAFLNEGRSAVLCEALADILAGVETATTVPWANIEQCGHFEDHDLGRAQALAREILAAHAHWLEIV